ncbi:storkhead-box protein 1 [Mustelus asterias]
MGDVSPIPMMPIAQSQFVPLAEVLCCVISEMNRSHKIVTQKALMEYLVKCYPGMAAPSHEILHHALGSLIQDRKIYHTGEGYFIVTPHTYFIAGNKGKQSHPRVLSDEHGTALAAVTYLVSVENDDEPVKEKILSDGAPHCKSCRCFSQQEVDKQQPEQQLSMEGITGQGNCKEDKPAVQHRATSTSARHQGSELGRVKEKQNPIQKFGLSLFRRNTKKSGTKRMYGTFSAQFPPEEWPVRDEGSQGNIPREVEHQLIKRINPALTMENLLRHTLLMKKLGRENTEPDHNTSTVAQLISKQRHHSKGSQQKALAGPQQHRRARFSKEKRLKCGKSLQMSESLLKTESELKAKEMANPRRSEGEQRLPEEPKIQPCRSNNPSPHFFKKRINNPFSKHHHTRNAISQRTEGCRRLGRKSQSLDSSTRASGAVLVRESAKDKFQLNIACNIRTSEADSKEQPQNCAVKTKKQNRAYKHHRIPSGCPAHDHPSKSQTPISSTGDHISNHIHFPGRAAEKSQQQQEKGDCDNVTKQGVSHDYGDCSVPQSWQDQAPKQAQIPAIPTTLNSGSVERFLNHSHPFRAQLMPQVQACLSEGETASQPETERGQSASYTDEDQTLYQRELDEDDACSSLYLNDDVEVTLCCQSPTALPGLGSCNDLGNEGVPAMLSNDSWLLTKILLQEQQTETCVFGEQHVASWLEVSNRSLEQSKACCGKECYVQLHRYHPMSQLTYEHLEEEEHLSGCGEAPELLGSNIFDYCAALGAEAGAETLQNHRNKGTRNPASQELWAEHQGMKTQLMRNLERSLQLLHHSHNTALSQTSQEENIHLETLENLSITGDSGIDSPRTRVSLASTNSIGLDSLKRRGLLQSYGTLNSTGRSGLLSQHPLLPLTPVMNV